jgi:hypothetical protein
LSKGVVKKGFKCRNIFNECIFISAKKKPHPFHIVGELSAELVREKCQRFLEKLETELIQPEELHLPIYAQTGQQNSSDQIQTDLGECKVLQPPLGKLNKIRRRDFLIRRTGASVTGWHSCGFIV